ncbi:unnamed protein product [Spirodela intermedia]|uniref:Uncharacterized protein n=2 Tax=Spirodela intermedia TaxID=51605 RepID=A0A7I8K1S6_SPIIN|nr:unnamed protein product [Spirodela intermedia]CAA6655062.1 unnamed protein product [Spirodela intermedia]CAA7389811.1 unnamed protein product [Spirodela intermedia]
MLGWPLVTWKRSDAPNRMWRLPCQLPSTS